VASDPADLRARLEKRREGTETSPCQKYQCDDPCDYGYRSCQRCGWAEPEHLIDELAAFLDGAAEREQEPFATAWEARAREGKARYEAAEAEVASLTARIGQLEHELADERHLGAGLTARIDELQDDLDGSRDAYKEQGDELLHFIRLSEQAEARVTALTARIAEAEQEFRAESELPPASWDTVGDANRAFRVCADQLARLRAEHETPS
jgi:hypothetical protein